MFSAGKAEKDIDRSVHVFRWTAVTTLENVDKSITYYTKREPVTVCILTRITNIP